MASYVLMLQTDTDDKELTESVLDELNLKVELKFLADANELDAFTAIAGNPALMLLSESSSKGRGIETVKKIKSNVSYSHIPVIVLAEQSLDMYIQEYYRAGANTFITKPSSLELTRKKIETFFLYWFEVAEVGLNKKQPAADY